MEHDELTKENPEAATATRWILGVGLGGILVFVILAYLWFGLSSSASNAATGPTAQLQTVPIATALQVTSSGQAAFVTASSSKSTITPIELSTISARPFPVLALQTPTPDLPTFTATPFLLIIATPTQLSIIIPTPEIATPTLSEPTFTPTPFDTATFSPVETTPPSTIIATAPTTEAPQVYLPKAAAQAFDNLQSLHFAIEIRAGKVEILPTTQLKRADGDLTRDKRFQAKVLAHAFIGDLTINTIGLDGSQYMTNPIGGKWSKLSSDQTFNLSVLFDPPSGIGGLTRQLQNVRVLSDETIDTVKCSHFVGTLPGSAVGPVTLGTLGHNPVTLDIWAGRDDNIIRQVYLKETVSNGAFWAINLSKFNETLNIQKPI